MEAENTSVLITDMNLLMVSAFANNPEKVAELKRKLERGEPLNYEELAVRAYVMDLKDNLIIAWTQFWNQLSDTFKRAFAALERLFDKSSYAKAKKVLTPRQYYLMLNGKPRVRNKWWNVAQRRLAQRA